MPFKNVMDDTPFRRKQTIKTIEETGFVRKLEIDGDAVYITICINPNTHIIFKAPREQLKDWCVGDPVGIDIHNLKPDSYWRIGNEPPTS